MNQSNENKGSVENSDEKWSHVIQAIKNDIEKGLKCAKCGKPEVSLRMSSTERKDGNVIHLIGALVLLLGGFALAVMTGYAFVNEEFKAHGGNPAPLGLGAFFCLATGQRLLAIFFRKKNITKLACKCTACGYQWFDSNTARILTIVNDLGHKEEAVRTKAIKKLGNTLSPLAVDALITLGSERNSRDELEEVIKALAKIGSAKATKFILERVKDEWGSVTTTAITSLGNIRNHDAVDTLSEAIKSDIKGVRVCASVSLGEIGGKNAKAILTQAIENEKSKVVRWRINNAFKKIKQNPK
jgi:hypothetical protein